MTAAQGAADPGNIPAVGSQNPASTGGGPNAATSGATVPLPPSRPAAADIGTSKVDNLTKDEMQRTSDQPIRGADEAPKDQGNLAYNTKRKRDQTLFA